MRLLNIHACGFTLIEMGVTVTIFGLIAMAVLPAFSSYLANARLREAANIVLASALSARNEAIKSNITTGLQLNGNRLEISNAAGGAPAVIRSHSLPDGVVVAPFTVSFDSAGRLWPFGTSMTVAVSSPVHACSDDIRCPAVRLDAGGTANICASGVCP